MTPSPVSAFPEPKPGLVLRHSYLWRREREEGRDDGAEDRPAVVVLVLAPARGEARPTVALLPVTHTPPRLPEDAVELPAPVKRRLGLDEARSWVVLTEANVFLWPGPDLRLVPRTLPLTAAYGALPPKVFDAVREGFVARLKSGRARLVRRTE